MGYKIINLQSENPDYFKLPVSRSPYDSKEIEGALESIRGINIRISELRNRAYDCLEDDDGPMDSLHGFATPMHQTLNEELFNLDEIHPNFSQNSHLKNCLPVKTWQKEVRTTNRQIEKIENIIKLLQGLK